MMTEAPHGTETPRYCTHIIQGVSQNRSCPKLPVANHQFSHRAVIKATFHSTISDIPMRPLRED